MARCKACDALMNYNYYPLIDKDDGLCKTCIRASEEDLDLHEYEHEGAYTGVTPQRKITWDDR